MGQKWRCAVVFGLIGVSGLAPRAGADDFSFESAPGRIDIRYGESPVATYVYEDDQISRPYFCNVFAPNGERLTRRYPTDPVANKDNDDHATYHPGIWLAFGDLGGEDYWRNDVRVRHVRFVEKPSVDGKSAKFVVENAYESKDNAKGIVCTERCTYSLHAEPGSYYLISESVFSSKHGFAFGDQEEMGLGVRMATPFTVQHGSGAIRNSEGGENERGTWGRTADWCSYFGEKDGVRIGVTIMPSPGNFRRSWFHTRDYGLVVANPFGTKAMTAAGDDGVAPDSTPVGANEHFLIGFGVRIFSEPRDLDSRDKTAYLRYEMLRQRVERSEE